MLRSRLDFYTPREILCFIDEYIYFIQDHSDHGASKKSNTPCPQWSDKFNLTHNDRSVPRLICIINVGFSQRSAYLKLDN